MKELYNEDLANIFKKEILNEVYENQNDNNVMDKDHTLSDEFIEKITNKIQKEGAGKFSIPQRGFFKFSLGVDYPSKTNVLEIYKDKNTHGRKKVNTEKNLKSAVTELLNELY